MKNMLLFFKFLVRKKKKKLKTQLIQLKMQFCCSFSSSCVLLSGMATKKFKINKLPRYLLFVLLLFKKKRKNLFPHNAQQQKTLSNKTHF